jgi:single-strand DNA-binding protein
MAGVNKVILIGHLGKDPEMRHIEGGTARVTFSLATSEYYKDKTGNRIEQTEWHHIVMWRGLAENAEKLLKKGSQVYIEGKLQTREWQDKEGIKRRITEIVAENFNLLGRKEGNTGNESSGNPSIPNPHGGDDLPF